MTDDAVNTFVDLCDADDVWEGDMQSFDVGEREVLVVNIDGALHAYNGTCPHQSVSLVEGTLEGKVLTCRAHLWQFDVCTGRGVNPDSARLRRCPIEVVAGKIRVNVEAMEDGPGVVSTCPGSANP